VALNTITLTMNLHVKKPYNGGIYLFLIFESGPSGCLQSDPSTGTHHGAAATYIKLNSSMIKLVIELFIWTTKVLLINSTLHHKKQLFQVQICIIHLKLYINIHM
jgi:hypothetical protein